MPPTATVARQQLASDPATRQVKVVEGDLFKDPIPAGHDVVLIANVMHLLSAERNLVLLPENADVLGRALPRMRSVLLDSGHFVWEDRAEDYAAAILDWIRGGYRAA